MIKKNWRQIDRMALDAMELVIDYCNITELCSDCIFYDQERTRCALVSLAVVEDYIEEVRRNE